ncbi:MAG: tRNA preQ1(34) S-adenosylmethionine ribosyltransferase-isomerase QueA [Spirochaetia bacterium]|nr:tRNA preQ1(34) S-adenosylmethionine ribosyltransferase-isomerase QueA [Spirochaetia bacterium]
MQRFVHPLIDEYYYDLPDELIARYPIEPPDACRLLQVSNRQINDLYFTNLPDCLEEGDLLVVNNTRVEARRVFLRRLDQNKNPGARIESVFLDIPDQQPDDAHNPCWSVLIKKRQRLKDKEILYSDVDENIFFTLHKYPDGRTFLEESTHLTPQLFDAIGQMPIPPYLQREEEVIDRSLYQNPFLIREKLQQKGSVAAPTAALHFTDSIIQKLKFKNIQIASLTLNISYGTFAPLKQENFTSGKLHEESYELPEELAVKLEKRDYNKLYAVGTTSLRVLETVNSMTKGKYNNYLKGKTNLFLYPPYQITSVNGMITNFHLPSSSLLMLTSCFTGKEQMMKIYGHAVDKRYRFFSYGDAMLIQT